MNADCDRARQTIRMVLAADCACREHDFERAGQSRYGSRPRSGKAPLLFDDCLEYCFALFGDRTRILARVDRGLCP
jgi:hypothetical protein